MEYRQDIQILRGLSVLLVVLFHLGIGGVQSGFLGVDVFFVISGFLMAVLYNKDKKVHFFLRRAKRLLPAYFVTILLSVSTVMFLTTFVEFGSVAKQSFFATIFSSNIGFWMENSYFSHDAFNPLLHLWSLGVEIQFYLLVPIIFWVLRVGKILFALGFIGSLLACFLMVEISPKTAFFMLPFRMWEFLIGYGAAIYFTDKGAVTPAFRASQIWPWAGGGALLLVAGISTLGIDGERTDFMLGHPGIYALLVSLATGGVLVFGLPEIFKRSKIAGFFEKLGTYSYSIYLVHFPVIVLFLYEPFEGTKLTPQGITPLLILIGIIAVLSVLMHHVVEKPVRSTKAILMSVLLFPCAVVALYFIGHYVQNQRFDEKEMRIFHAWTDRAPYRCGKISRVLHPSDIVCEITKGVESPTRDIMLIGNSHADSIKTTFASVAQNLGVRVYFTVRNEPLMDSDLTPERLVQEALKRNIRHLVLHFSPNALSTHTLQELSILSEAHDIHLSFILPVPTWKAHIPKSLWKNVQFGAALPTQSMADYEEKNSVLLDYMEGGSFMFYPVHQVFCAEGSCALSDGAGRPLYFDGGHMTLTGSEILRPVFENVIRDILQDSPAH